MNKNSLNFVDIFCGAGGFSSGLESSGHKCILGIDYEKSAIETFKENHKNSMAFHGNICDLTNSNLKKMLKDTTIDLIVGGPPCQGFSTVGKGDPNDQRNKLFLEYFRIVKLLKPKFIIIENVTGLIAQKNTFILNSIFKKFKSIGYDLDCKVLSADNYQVPSRRRRTIFIGNNQGIRNIYPDEIKDKILTGEALRKINQKLPNHDLRSARINNKIDLERIKRIPQGKGIRYQKDEDAYFNKKLKLNIDWSKLRENRLRQTKYQRLDRRTVAPTILTHRNCYYHPSQDRYLTIREAARLQSFPDHFKFMGTITSQWRQLGNAVPPKLAFHLGASLKKMNTLKRNKLVKEISREEYLLNVRERAFSY